MDINLYSKLHVSDAKNDLNGPGIRTILTLQGCQFNCPKCNLPEAFDVSNGICVDVNKIKKDILNMGNNLTITGGEPILQTKACLEIVSYIKKEKPYLNIWLYTGFTFEELLNSNNEGIISLLKNINILVDGKFIEEERIPGINLKGSYNQRILDSKRSLELGIPIIVFSYDKYNRYYKNY